MKEMSMKKKHLAKRLIEASKENLKNCNVDCANISSLCVPVFSSALPTILIPDGESDPRLYSAFSSRDEIDPLNPLLFENFAPLRFTTCWRGAWLASLSPTPLLTRCSSSQNLSWKDPMILCHTQGSANSRSTGSFLVVGGELVTRLESKHPSSAQYFSQY